MASSAAWLLHLLPETADLEGQACSIQRYGGGVAGILFDKPAELGTRGGDPVCFWSGTLPGSATLGYSATTGIKVEIIWCTPNGNATGSVIWATAFDLKGATDKPIGPANANFPAYGASNEATVTTAVTASPVGGVTYSVTSNTIANIQNGQTTAPAIGDHFRVRVRRKVESASDTLSGPAIMLAGYLLDY